MVLILKDNQEAIDLNRRNQFLNFAPYLVVDLKKGVMQVDRSKWGGSRVR